MTAPVVSIFPNAPLMKSCGRRADPIALQPRDFMKLADALHHSTSPAIGY